MPVFTSSTSDGLDHIKYLVYQKEPYLAPQNGQELVYEGVMGSTQFFPNTIPFPYALAGVNDAQADIRLSSGGFNIVDLETYMVFDFLMSNNQIYAFYERLPFGKPQWDNTLPDYKAFSSAIPVASKTATSLTKLAIAPTCALLGRATC